MRTSPPSIASRPDRQLRSVVLPQPEGPMIATIAPRSTARSTPLRALTRTAPVSYVLTRRFASTIGAPMTAPFLVCFVQRRVPPTPRNQAVRGFPLRSITDRRPWSAVRPPGREAGVGEPEPAEHERGRAERGRDD